MTAPLEQAEQATARARADFHRMPSRRNLTRLLAAHRHEALAALRSRGQQRVADYLDKEQP